MINSIKQMTDQSWIQDPNGGQPPGFFFSQAQRPHLHVTSSFADNQMNPPWNLAYLAYTDNQGNATVIYKQAIQGVSSGIDNPGAINNIPNAFQAQALWAYGLK